MTRFHHRVIRALLALWLAVLTAEPALVHACPMHDGLAVAQAPSHANPHAGHAGHGSSSNNAPAEKHACSCIGTCSLTLGPVATPVGVSRIAIVSGTAAGTPAHVRAVVATEYAIPFANGPPLS